MDGIIEALLLKGWRGVYIDKYDGTSDPDKHLAKYDAIPCRIFLTPLKRLALQWYTQLPANSIDSFVTLKKKFNTQYSTSCPHHLTLIALVNLQQGEGEPLRSFMARFSNLSIMIYNLNPEVALHSMSNCFITACIGIPPMTMDKLRMRATSYIQMEEMIEFRDSVHAGQSSVSHNHKEHGHFDRSSEKKGRNDWPTREPKYQVFTPLPLNNNPMVITIEVAYFAIKKVLINQDTSPDILYMSIFRCLQNLEVEIPPYHKQLVGFLGECVDMPGYIDLLTTFGDPYAFCMISVCYLVVEVETSYNVLISCLVLNTPRA
ncbi:hypothetical protein CR513_61475, partial [Mucuna pruriens]